MENKFFLHVHYMIKYISTDWFRLCSPKQSPLSKDLLLDEGDDPWLDGTILHGVNDDVPA